jgi:hypothetical protein
METWLLEGGGTNPNRRRGPEFHDRGPLFIAVMNGIT